MVNKNISQDIIDKYNAALRSVRELTILLKKIQLIPVRIHLQHYFKHYFAKKLRSLQDMQSWN